MTSAAAASSCSAEEALARARDCLDAGDDDNAARLVELSLQKAPAATNPQAAVLKEWLLRFGKGSAADTSVRRVLACPAGDFYAVLGAPRFQEPPRQEYLKLSLLLHPDKCGARNTSAAFQRITEAYNALKDPEQRSRYDDKLRRAEARQQQSHAQSQQPQSSSAPFRAAGGGAGAGFGGQPRSRPGFGGPFGRSSAGPSSTPYPVAQLRDACARLPVDQLLLALERLGESTNTRSHTKLVDQLHACLLRLEPKHRAPTDPVGRLSWAFGRLAQLKAEALAVKTALEAECARTLAGLLEVVHYAHNGCKGGCEYSGDLVRVGSSLVRMLPVPYNQFGDVGADRGARGRQRGK